MNITRIAATDVQPGDIVNASNAIFAGSPIETVAAVATVGNTVFVNVVGGLAPYAWNVGDMIDAHELIGDRTHS